MATYYDSSALLEVLLGGRRSRQVISCWDADAVRVSSLLLEAECLTVLRRAASQSGLRPRSATLRERFAALDGYLDSLVIREVDRDALDILRATSILPGCRSLDALHLATAMLFQRHLDEPLKLCTFDARMRESGGELGLAVIPR